MKLPKKLLTGGTVSVATLGLSTCNDNGAVDPAPPPLNCAVASNGQTLRGQGVLVEPDLIQLTVSDSGRNQFIVGTATITDTVGVTVENLDFDDFEIIAALRVAPGVTSGTLNFKVTLGDFSGRRCEVVRPITFSINNGVLTLALLERRLPLHSRTGAVIAMLRREGLEVHLGAEAAPLGEMNWSVTAGELIGSGPAVFWKLPEAPGFYMAELVVDYGLDGLSFDTLMLEVS